MTQLAAIEALLLAHEAELPALMRRLIRAMRGEVEHCFQEATPSQHLALGVAILSRIVRNIEQSLDALLGEDTP